jgi:hypothetical protein
VIGLRGRFNLNKTFYLIAQTDVGGFGIGSDIAVEAYAALGCQFTVISFPRLIIGTIMMTSATAASFISCPCTAHRSRSGSPFSLKCEVKESDPEMTWSTN